jgi:cytochrome c-type biogenesis protein CcmH/NrfG
MDQKEQARRSESQLTLISAFDRERGWFGLIAILVALVIVAVLAQTALKTYGLLPGAETSAKAGPRGPGVAAPAEVDPTTATPAPNTPIERAHGLEQQVQRDAQELGKRIDEQTK